MAHLKAAMVAPDQGVELASSLAKCSMQSFPTETLSAGSLLEAWPLVHLALPGMDLATWRGIARVKPGLRRHVARSGIILARRIARRQICGMVWYHAEVDLSLGRVLRARHLFAIDLLDTGPILISLLNSLGPIAKALGCATIRLATPDDEPRDLAVHAILARISTRLEHWLEVSLSADRLCRAGAVIAGADPASG